VETLVRGDLNLLWRRTQDPADHVRWDLRFSRITPLGRAPDGHEMFEYALDLPGHRLHGRTLSGTGTSVGERSRPDGSRTSALRFTTPDRLSLLRRGSGYWRYVPTAEGVRFLTGYDYQPGWGRAGAVIDLVAFRPLIGWMTAWSFDRLRLWVERDQDPAESTRRALINLGTRVMVLVPAVLAIVAPIGSRLPRPIRAALALAGFAAVLARTPATVPKAGRCLRRAPDKRSGRAPRTLDHLAEPGADS